MKDRVCISYWEDGHIHVWENEYPFRSRPKCKQRFRICYRVKVWYHTLWYKSNIKEQNNAA